jgi:hypothetical protein
MSKKEDSSLELIARLNKDLREAAKTLDPNEARYLVDLYYTIQENRKASTNQIGSTEEPNRLLEWFAGQHRSLENNIKRVLDVYTDHHPIGIWAKSISGIGPVIAAGLLAHIDITKAPTVGSVWRYAGLDPSAIWEKKTKRPWNANLKVLCWKIGESFVKVSGLEADFYGKVYIARKDWEISRNEAGELKEQADKALEKKIGKTTDAYKAYIQGKLPPAHIHARAKRYAVKLFLSHLHEKMYELEYGKKPPEPYCFSHLGHAHKIEPPEAPKAKAPKAKAKKKVKAKKNKDINP